MSDFGEEFEDVLCAVTLCNLVWITDVSEGRAIFILGLNYPENVGSK